MRLSDEKGLTLVELIVVISIMGLISVAVTTFLSSVLDVHSSSSKKSELYREGLLAMERMTSGVRRCTFLLIPNSHNATRDILVSSMMMMIIFLMTPSFQELMRTLAPI